jgi:hypothetical protein
MSVLIEGTAFPIGKKNANGWGVPASEVDNALASLLNSVVRICTRDAEHGCDLIEDPNTEIGRVVDAWYSGDEVKIRAEVTDSTARQKIEDGTWEPAWSVYGTAENEEDGWVQGYQNRSVTLVRNPAWEEATYSVAAAKQADYLVFSSKYTIQTPGGEPMTDENNLNENGNPAEGGENPEATLEQLQNEIAERDKQIEELKNNSSKVEASNTKLQKKVEELEQVLASREKEKATSVPMEKVNELIETKANEIAAARIKEYRDELQRTAALEKLTAARSELGLETKGEEYKHLSAADLEKLADEFGGIKVTAGTMFQYPAGESGKSRTGVYNPVSGVFE